MGSVSEVRDRLTLVIDHYYHFAAELLLGVWRVHATQDQNIDAHGNTNLRSPSRAWFLHQDSNQW